MAQNRRTKNNGTGKMRGNKDNQKNMETSQILILYSQNKRRPCLGTAGIGKFLHLPLNFSVNQKLL